MLPVEVLVPGANSRSTCKHCGIYTGPYLLEPYKSHNIYIYKATYNNMMNIFLVTFNVSWRICRILPLVSYIVALAEELLKKYIGRG